MLLELVTPTGPRAEDISAPVAELLAVVEEALRRVVLDDLPHRFPIVLHVVRVPP